MPAHARQVKMVEFTARYGWRVIRPFVKGKLSRRCRRCILPTGHGPLDANGLCKECAEYDAAKTASQPAADETRAARLGELLRSHAGRGTGGYDAVLLLSGGKDSAYMLDRISREVPELRIVTMLVDNGFMSPFAIENAKQILRRFDIPHVHLQLKPSLVKTGFRYMLTHLDRQKGYSIVDILDGLFTFDHAKTFAAQQGIPLVILGLQQAQLANFGSVDIEFKPMQERHSLCERAGIPLSDVFDTTQLGGFFDPERWSAEKTPRFVLPFLAWDVSEDDIIKDVTSRSLISAGQVRPLMTNNALIPVIGMAEVARFGYSCWEVQFSRNIREGKQQRGYWASLFEMLEFSTKTGKFINKTVDETLARLDLTKRDIGIGKT